MNHENGVGHVRSDVALESCEALSFTFEPDGLRQRVVWRGQPTSLRPSKTGKRIRDLRAGDVVTFEGEELIVKTAVLYRCLFSLSTSISKAALQCRRVAMCWGAIASTASSMAFTNHRPHAGAGEAMILL